MEALVQLRGEVDVSDDVVDTLEMLNLGRVNHATFVPETDAYGGMITKVHDVVAHGEPSVETVELLLERRAEPAEGEEDIDDEWVGWNTNYDDVSALAEALLEEETTLQEAGLSPTLRLHPPRKGHDGIKHPTTEGGQLGDHTTEEIDDLLEAMR
ncbi:50S ribosomal protein L30 [Halorhabdus amylolytica]|uniref:50S ribosomal protein L30 n=1 Tax=Halorhabdus amylolytica TaxID=2559573 RepID=UPI0010A9A1C6|nr:50S ribosomal protein L30 [Halorhabdus amylolytica]